MKIALITTVILLTVQLASAQGYGIGEEFYPDSIPDENLYNQDFWEEKVK